MVNPAWTFRFMDLPVELREVVYGNLLHDHFTFVTNKFHKVLEEKWKQQRSADEYKRLRSHCVKWSGGWSIGDPIRNISILMVSRLLHQEAAPILYSSDFAFEHHDLLNRFVDCVGRMRPHIKKLQFLARLDWTARHTRSRTLRISDLTSLRRLRIYCAVNELTSTPLNLENLVANIAASLRTSYKSPTDSGDNADRILDMVVFEGRPGSDIAVDRCASMTVKVRDMLQAALKIEG